MSIEKTLITALTAVSILGWAVNARGADLDLKRFISAQDKAGPAGAIGYTKIQGKVAKKRAVGARR